MAAINSRAVAIELVSSTRKLYKIAYKFAFLVPILALLGAIPIALAQQSGLVMTPSKITDYPGNNAAAIQVQVANAYRDSVGYYHIQGEVTNMGTSTISSVQVTVHFYNSNNQLIGDADGYTSPSNLDAGHTGTFDVLTDQINGFPAIFRLSYDWS
jgi:hypothetical protein